MKNLVSIILMLSFILSTGNLMSQDDASTSEDAAALAKQAANPIANMISVPMQYNLNFNVGKYNRTAHVFNIMPVLPFKMFNWNVINRIIIPIVNSPDTTETGNYFGLGNINYSMLFVPPPGKIFQWGFGPAFNIPTRSSSNLGVNAFAMGPAVIFLFMLEKWVIGITANHVWTYANDESLNSTFIQYFITYNIKDGWYVNTNPMMTANWYAPEGDEWVIPLGAGGGKVFSVRKQSMKLQAQLYYNVVAPPGSADMTVQIQYVLLFPHK